MKEYSIGIDSGSVATKAVLFDGQKIIKKVIIPTGWSPKRTSLEAYNLLTDKVDKDKIKKVIGTGYGRVSMDFVDKKVTEITCHTKGIFFLNKDVRTILDIGGQDSKVINIDNDGNVINFIMNDKCAAGTGKFLEVTSNKLGSDIENIDELAKDAIPENISSMCTVFAESEIISLLAQDIPKENIAAGILKSIANKGISILNKGNLEDIIAFTGGLAKSNELVKMLEEKLNKQIDILYRADINERIGFDLSEEKVNLKKDLDDLFSASLSNGVEVYYNSNPDELKVIKSIEEFRDYAIDILVPELSGFEVSEEEITKMEKEVKSWTYTDLLEFCEGNDIEIVPLKKEKTIEIEKSVKEVRIKNKPMEL